MEYSVLWCCFLLGSLLAPVYGLGSFAFNSTWTNQLNSKAMMQEFIDGHCQMAREYLKMKEQPHHETSVVGNRTGDLLLVDAYKTLEQYNIAHAGTGKYKGLKLIIDTHALWDNLIRELGKEQSVSWLHLHFPVFRGPCGRPDKLKIEDFQKLIISRWPKLWVFSVELYTECKKGPTDKPYDSSIIRDASEDWEKHLFFQAKNTALVVHLKQLSLSTEDVILALLDFIYTKKIKYLELRLSEADTEKANISTVVSFIKRNTIKETNIYFNVHDRFRDIYFQYLSDQQKVPEVVDEETTSTTLVPNPDEAAEEGINSALGRNLQLGVYLAVLLMFRFI